MNKMKAFAHLHWRFFCGKMLSTTYSMLLWKLFGLFSLRFPGRKWKICRDQSRLTFLSPSFAAWFHECSVHQLSKGLNPNQKEIYIWLFCSSNMVHLCSNISECISTEPTKLSFPFTSKLNTFVRSKQQEHIVLNRS